MLWLLATLCYTALVMNVVRPILFAVTVASCLLTTAFIGLGAHSDAPAKPKTAFEQFKNIQILKDVPADQLLPTMQFISNSLGVECSFCHVEDKSKDDKKPKQTARKMMTMMLAINKNHFDGEREVTCNTCHRGATHPMASPAIPDTFTEPAPEVAASAPSITADQVFDKYIEALGGADALHKVSTRVEKGNIDFNGKKLPIEVYQQAPDKRVSITQMPNGESVTAYNGQQGWLANANGGVREMSAADLTGARLDAEALMPLNLKQSFAQLRVRPADKIGDRAVNVVIGLNPDPNHAQPPVRLYFDQQSGLLLRMVRYTDTALGLNPTEVNFDDYRDSGGVKTPYRWTIARPLGRFTIQIDSAQANAPIDEKKFVKPESPPQH